MRNLKPKKAKVTDPVSVDAWWYENARSIEIYVDTGVRLAPGRTVVSVRITRSQIESWLNRARLEK
jgi:hypothetical protein